MKRACSQCNIKRDQTSFVGTRGRICALCRKKNAKLAARKRLLQSVYGITVEEYDAMASGGCNICGGSRRYQLHVDHDHALAEQFGARASVRGVLCRRCNKLLRDIRDSSDLLVAARRYLLDPPSKKVLFP